MKGQMCWIFEVVCQVFLGLLNYISICLNYVQLRHLAALTLCPSPADFTLIQTFMIFWKKKTQN